LTPPASQGTIAGDKRGASPAVTAMYVTCPQCGRQSWVEGRPRALCRCLHCGAQFVGAWPERPQPPAVPPPRRETPRLTRPHRCHQCGADIDVPPDRRRCTVDCPWCGQRTSAYALVYRCLGCRALLASPAAQEGTATACPCCGEAVVVPRDCLFRERGEPADAAWFAFDCPHCLSRLETRKSLVGQLGVCPHCLNPVEVPHWGYRVEPLPRPADPLAALGGGTLRPCPHCGLLKPTRAPSCPSCGGDDP
jgi:hypothetical protein